MMWARWILHRREEIAREKSEKKRESAEREKRRERERERERERREGRLDTRTVEVRSFSAHACCLCGVSVV